jgi:ABC-type phosphate transport system substrate-binding protein
VKFTKTLAAAAGVGLVAAGLLSASPASADPSGTPAGGDRALAGVGSDTTQNVMNDLAEVITITGVKQIASWDAIGSPATFTTRTTLPVGATNCTYTRTEANGSGNGRSRLLESLTTGNARTGCLDFARSSSGRGTFTSTPSMTWIPFAKDASTFIVRADGGVPRNILQADLINVFKCANTPDIWPVLPQTNSGSRAYWVTTVLGITEAQISTPGSFPCLVPVGTPGFTAAQATGRPYVQENNGIALKTDEIMPFSIGLFNVQAAGTNTDTRGPKNTMGQISSSLPVGANAATFPLTRSLYNIIPTDKVAVAPWSTVFVGSSSLVCTSTSTILANGFTPLTAASSPVCGSQDAS